MLLSKKNVECCQQTCKNMPEKYGRAKFCHKKHSSLLYILALLAQISNMKNKILGIVSVLILSFAIFLAGCGSNQNVTVDKISISKKNLYLAEGQTAEISAQVFPFNATNQNYILTSSDSGVVTVIDGFVVANKAGEATITATSEDGGYCDTCNVLVTTVKDNLALNDYNNMNMPKNVNLENQSQKNSSQKAKASMGKMISNLTSKVAVQMDDAKNAGESVLNQMRAEIETSLQHLEAEKQNLLNFSKLSSQDKQNSFENLFENLQIEIVDSIKNIKQDMLDSIDNAKQKIEDGEYFVDTKDINGVTFVVVSNRQNNAQPSTLTND